MELRTETVLVDDDHFRKSLGGYEYLVMLTTVDKSTLDGHAMLLWPEEAEQLRDALSAWLAKLAGL